MNPKNKAKADYLRIPAWSQYDGTGITIAVWEDTSQGHGKGSLDTINQLAPGARVISRPRVGYRIKSGELTPESKQTLIENYQEQLAQGVSIVTLSIYGNDNKALAELQKQILVEEGGCTLLVAAGNDSQNIESRAAGYYDGTWFAVGACFLINGKPQRAYYSNVGDKLDVMMFEGWYNDSGYKFGGTSSAAPALAACLARYQQFFKEQSGRTPKPEEMWRFIRDNSEDLEEPGWDNLTGHGLFRLPMEVPDFRQLLMRLGVYQVPEFIDVPDDRWSKLLIDQAASRGLMTGYPDNTFKPGQALTREEAAALVVRLDARIEQRYQELREALRKAGIAV